MTALDTNILLLDANNLFAFSNPILLAETVVDEIDSKKSELGEIGYQARSFGRIMAKARLHSTTKTEQFSRSVFTSGDTEIHIVSLQEYPNFNDTASNIINDRKIIAVAKHFQAKFISNDIMARVRASSEGLETSEFRVVENLEYTFTKHLTIPHETFMSLGAEPISILSIDPTHVPQNYNYVFTSTESDQIKLGTVSNCVLNIITKSVEDELRQQDIPPMNAQQLLFSDHLQNPNISMVLCESAAGTGKSAVAISNGIRLVRQNQYDGILYIRSSVNDVDPVEEVGFLPGMAEKFAVYLHPLEDTLDFIVRNKQKGAKVKGAALEAKIIDDIQSLKERANIQAMTTLGMRGRTFSNQYVVIDEFQNLSAQQSQKILTRIGKGCKIVILGSNNQIDNKYITKHTNGLGVLLNAATKPNNFIDIAAVDLTRIVRSPMSEFAERLFSK